MRGCITILIGSNKQQLMDVDLSSTSVNLLILSALQSKTYKELNKSVIDNLYDLLITNKSESLNIDVILENSNAHQVISDIGDKAIGNLNPNLIGAILRTRYSSTLLLNILKLLNKLNIQDNNILLTTDVNPVIYIGSNRDFILINSDMLNDIDSMTSLFTFLYVSKYSTKSNSKVYDLLTLTLDQIKNNYKDTYDNHFKGLTPKQANKKLAVMLFSNLDFVLYKNVLINTVEELETTPFFTHSLLNPRITKEENFLNSTITLPTASGTDITITNKVVLNFLKEVSSIDTSTVTAKDFPKNYQAFYEKYKKNNKSEYYGIIKGLFESPDMDIKNLFNKKETQSNILSYIYEKYDNKLKSQDAIKNAKPVNTVLPAFIVESDDYSFIEESGVSIQESNIALNKLLNTFSDKSISKSAKIIINPKATSFAKYTKSTLQINPTKSFSELDVVEIKKALTNYKNFIFINDSTTKINPTNKESFKLLFRALNQNKALIQSLHTDVSGPLSLVMAEAAVESGILTNLYINYVKRTASDLKNLIKTISKTFNRFYDKFSLFREFSLQDLNKFLNREEKGLFVTKEDSELFRHPETKTARIQNTKTNESATYSVVKVIDFMPKMDESLLDSNGYVKVGTVFQLDSEEYFGYDAVITKRLKDGSYEAIIISRKTNNDKNKGKVINVTNPTNLNYLSKVVAEKNTIYYATHLGIFANDGNNKLSDTFSYLRVLAAYKLELKDIYKYENDKDATDLELEDFTQVLISNYKSHHNVKYFIFSKYNPNRDSVNYDYSKHSKNLMDLIINKIRSMNIDVLEDNDSKHKAYIKNGVIYINRNKATLDSPIHEFMHLFIGAIKATNPEEYNRLLDNINESNPLWSELQNRYSELTYRDFQEEVLVHQISEFLANRILDYGSNGNILSSLDLNSIISRVLEVGAIYSNNYRKDTSTTPILSILFSKQSNLLGKVFDNWANTLKTIVKDNKLSYLKSLLFKDELLTQKCE